MGVEASLKPAEAEGFPGGQEAVTLTTWAYPVPLGICGECKDSMGVSLRDCIGITLRNSKNYGLQRYEHKSIPESLSIRS